MAEHRMAQARSVIHVVGAKEARGLLRHVVDLVRHPARGAEEGHAAGIGLPETAGRTGNRIVPGDPPETARASLAEHRIREAAHFAELAVIELA